MQIIAEKRGRIDKLLADSCPQYSRAALAKLFDMDLVKLDGMTVKAGHKVREGAVIEADISPLNQEQQVVELEVLYEDDDVIVVNKPVGIISHARGRYWYEPSVASFIKWYIAKHLNKNKGKVIENAKHTPEDMVTKSYPIISGVQGIDRTGIVHRLDRATSGVMICTKNDNAMTWLQKQFASRDVEKSYVAVLSAIPEHDEAIIDAPIERNPKQPSLFRVGPNGKPSQTHYKVVKKGEDTCLVEFTPKTGRTHQLRVHALYIRCPILGDEFYGQPAARLYLHAHKLTITLPNGKRTTFEAPLPKEFADAVN